MKTLNLYVTKNLLIVFMAAIFLMNFIMMAGQLIKILELLSSGMSLTSFIKIFMLALPEVLAFALPISMLMAVTLVFSKMSSENEITALRASGISLWQITSPGLVLSVIISIFCLYLQLYMIPHCKFNLKNAKNNLAMENPSAVLTAGASIDMNGAFITVGDRKGDQLYRVSITKPSITGKTERIYGERGTIEVDESGQMLTLELEGEVVLRIIEKEDGKPS
ncbi:MAG: YjgP/YjgQ family permease, partial [Lentisphaeraceae bacterium]|nr:YjgP/YjgQ family permease [Lentisphaeraceae bacterium]